MSISVPHKLQGVPHPFNAAGRLLQVLSGPLLFSKIVLLIAICVAFTSRREIFERERQSLRSGGGDFMPAERTGYMDRDDESEATDEYREDDRNEARPAKRVRASTDISGGTGNSGHSGASAVPSDAAADLLAMFAGASAVVEEQDRIEEHPHVQQTELSMSHSAQRASRVGNQEAPHHATEPSPTPQQRLLHEHTQHTQQLQQLQQLQQQIRQQQEEQSQLYFKQQQQQRMAQMLLQQQQQRMFQDLQPQYLAQAGQLGSPPVSADPQLQQQHLLLLQQQQMQQQEHMQKQMQQQMQQQQQMLQQREQEQQMLQMLRQDQKHELHEERQSTVPEDHQEQLEQPEQQQQLPQSQLQPQRDLTQSQLEQEQLQQEQQEQQEQQLEQQPALPLQAQQEQQEQVQNAKAQEQQRSTPTVAPQAVVAVENRTTAQPAQ